MTRASLHPLWLALVLSSLFVGRAVRAAEGPARAKATAVLNASALAPGEKAVLAVVVDIQEGFHAQSHSPSESYYIKFKLKLDPNEPLTAGEPLYPAGKDEQYKDLGKLNIYTGRVIVYVPLETRPDVRPGETKISGKVRLQICDEKSCYPPEDLPFSLQTKVVPTGEAVKPANPEIFSGYDPTATPSTAPSTAPSSASGGSGSTNAPATFDLFGMKATGSYLFAFLAAIVIGALFNVMPCVLPVVPLKAIGFYEVSQHNRGRSVALGAVFSLGIVVTFAVLGLFVVVLKKLAWGELYSNAWFSAAIVVILAVMALSMFGTFSVNLPTGIYRFAPRHDTFSGNFLFGILTAILSTPCTFGMFLGLLTWALTQPPAIGLALVINVGVGMALPYLLLSAAPELARRFPRTGPWAELVKQMMGFLLLGSAIYFARRWIDRFSGEDATWWAIFAVAVVAAIFLVTRTIRFSKTVMPRWIAVSIAVLIIAGSFVAVRSLTNRPYEWQPYTPQALADARAKGRPVLVEFTATWCFNCQYLESFVLHDKRVVEEVGRSRVLMLRADLTDEDAIGKPLLKTLNPAGGIPFTAVYSSESDEPIRLSGVYGTEDLRAAIQRATGKKQVAQAR